MRDAAQAYIEILLEKGGSVPVDEGVETVNVPVVTVMTEWAHQPAHLLRNTPVRKIIKALEKDGFRLERGNNAKFHRLWGEREFDRRQGVGKIIIMKIMPLPLVRCQFLFCVVFS